MDAVLAPVAEGVVLVFTVRAGAGWSRFIRTGRVLTRLRFVLNVCGSKLRAIRLFSGDLLRAGLRRVLEWLSVDDDDKTTEETTEPTGDGGTTEANEDHAAVIADLRAKLAEVEPIVQAHKDAEDARKTVEEKLREDLAAAQRERDDAQRAVMLSEVAEETGLPVKVVKRLVGATKDELMAAAKEIAEVSGKRGATSARPNPTVGGGTDSTSEPESLDPAKLAAAITKRARF
ncbi:hypothetical protein [Microtetraspora malaysiensis]|uniref:hypothetical protein n=1 Tax=Microtetraspora malaysiensis TaxID=161358 RepID=UPI003D8F6BF0